MGAVVACWVDRDHEYCGPIDGGDGLIKKLDQLKAVGFRVLLTRCDGDLLVDRQMEVVKMLEGKGVEVVDIFCWRR